MAADLLDEQEPDLGGNDHLLDSVMKLINVNRIKVRSRAGFTLLEVIVSFLIAGITTGGMIKGYIVASRRAEWSAYSLAAQSMAVKRLEQVVSARWIPQYDIDQLVQTNFPPRTEYLCLPTQQTNLINCTNYTHITIVTGTPLMKVIRVDCVWSFIDMGKFTNTIATLRAPNL